MDRRKLRRLGWVADREKSASRGERKRGLLIILPYISFTVKTDDSPAEVRRRLADQVGRRGWFRFPAPDLPYAGAVWNDGFKVIRLSRSLYCTTPVICGSFEARPAGTVVQVTMRLDWGDAAFFCVFIGFFVALMIVTVLSDLWALPIMLAMLVFVVFVIGMVLTRFRRQAAQWRIELVHLLLGPDDAELRRA